MSSAATEAMRRNVQVVLSEPGSDGRSTPEVGSWAEDKYRLLRLYATLFATSMKSKWDARVYIDLFAGPGKVAIEGTGRVVDASPLIALGIPDPFDRYLFCEKKPRFLETLRRRIETLRPPNGVDFLCGDANELAERIVKVISSRRSERVLSFCFADPYKLKDLQFSTIRTLSSLNVDFLILLPTGMDANRNWRRYLRPENTVVDDFVGTSAWRDAWTKAAAKGAAVDVFLTDFYRKQMKSLGYRFGGVEDSVLVRSTEKRLPLYRLGFFSRHPLGQKFWNEARKYSQVQRSLFE